MSKFLYEAKNDKGQLVHGEVQAANETAAEKLLMRNKLVVTSLEPEKSPLSVLLMVGRISVRQRAQFARQLATMIDAGLPLVQALSIILMQTKNPAMHSVLSSVIRDIEGGYSFSTALSKHPLAFDRIFVSIVRSGEATGKLDAVLLELATQLEKDSAFSGKLKGALAYPVFIISAMIGVGVLMMIKVIPTIKGIFDEAGAQLPFATRLLISVSDAMVKYWYIFLIAAVGLLLLIRIGLATPKGKALKDRFVLHAPIISGTVVSAMMARTTRTLGLLVGAGIPILESLRIVSEVVNNIVYKSGLEEVRAEVERGIPMSAPLMNNTSFPVLFGQMVAVGEQTGRVDTMLGNLAKYYTEETENRLKNVSSLIEPIVMVILGIGVAVLIFAILIPIYNIASIGA